MWGKYGLPFPRSHKIFCAIGSPIDLPYPEDPTDEEINIWHAKILQRNQTHLRQI